MWTWYVQSRSAEYALERLGEILQPDGLTTWLGAEVGPYLKERAEARFQIRLSQNYGAGPINRRTGELEDWVVNSGWRAYPNSTGGSLAYPGAQPSGELLEKVQTAQKGSPYPPTVPRPVLGVNENDMLYVLSMFATFISEEVKV
jgi:hypothetical protein